MQSASNASAVISCVASLRAAAVALTRLRSPMSKAPIADEITVDRHRLLDAIDETIFVGLMRELRFPGTEHTDRHIAIHRIEHRGVGEISCRARLGTVAQIFLRDRERSLHPWRRGIGVNRFDVDDRR